MREPHIPTHFWTKIDVSVSANICCPTMQSLQDSFLIRYLWRHKTLPFWPPPTYVMWPGGGGTGLERGYGDVRPWRPPFHASPAARKGPILSKRVSSQDPLLRKFGHFSLYSLNFHPNFSSQAPKFGNFQLTSPQIWKFSTRKPPFQRQMSVRKPHTSEIQATHPYLKKSWVPPPGCDPLLRKKREAPIAQW